MMAAKVAASIVRRLMLGRVGVGVFMGVEKAEGPARKRRPVVG